ncbi:hypothetical protein Gohar_002925 [Gossypium harknessii]|uniref:Uncharacterized protein n=1 Tax=Gossypium harknessii TaxID=34285 RepID=A0A7J9HQ24_9ROSI|nr:hypothetical protein [Gossypium harknessii]
MSLVRYNRWERFHMTLKENVVIPLVHELYATLRDKETRRPHGVQWKLLMVRGKDVPFTPKTICEFYDAPYYGTNFLENIDLDKFEDINMKSIVKYLTGNHGEWKLRPDIGLLINYNQAIMFPVAKIWIDDTLQKRRGSTRGERAIHVPNERMFQRHLKGKENRHLEKKGTRIEAQEAEVGKESTEEREEDEETNYFEEEDN